MANLDISKMSIITVEASLMRGARCAALSDRGIEKFTIPRRLTDE